MVEGRGGDKDSFCSHTCSVIQPLRLKTVNSPVTVEVSKVVWKTWKTWNLTRMDLRGGRHLTCLRTLCSKLTEQYNRVCHNISRVSADTGSVEDNIKGYAPLLSYDRCTV